ARAKGRDPSYPCEPARPPARPARRGRLDGVRRSVRPAGAPGRRGALRATDMTHRIKFLAALGLPGLLLAGTQYLERTSLSTPPPDGAATGCGGGALGEEFRRRAQLEEDGRILLWTTAAKTWLTGEVARRRLGLPEGAAAPRAVDACLLAR